MNMNKSTFMQHLPDEILVGHCCGEILMPYCAHRS